MNSFALLNDSDDEAPVKVATQKKTTPKETAPKKVVPGLPPKATKPTGKSTTADAPAVTDDGEFIKENARGGKAFGKDTKQKEEYRKKHSDADPRKKHERDRRPAAGQ
jgi:hypothetical protein